MHADVHYIALIRASNIQGVVMSFEPVPPTTRVEPELIAPDTYVIHSVQAAAGAPLSVYLNSMVIAGEEPVIVDTNTMANREQFLADVFSIVAPEDVRWVYLSHDDIDHTGNLWQVMEACPNATLVASWSITERHGNAFEFPLDRMRWVNEGDEWDAGDRTLRAVRPPLYDSPTTRGLFDTKTGVYWGVDAFAVPMPGGPVSTFAELDPNFVPEGMAMFMHNALSPWLSLVDPQKYAAACDAVQALDMRVIATAHAPVITEETIDKAFEVIRDMPNVPAPPVPDQVVLEAILAGTGQ
jgi:flavorubredoxin